MFHHPTQLGKDVGKYSGGDKAGGNHCCCFTSRAASALDSPQPLICGGSCVYTAATTGDVQECALLHVDPCMWSRARESVGISAEPQFNFSRPQMRLSLVNITWKGFIFICVNISASVSKWNI